MSTSEAVNKDVLRAPARLVEGPKVERRPRLRGILGRIFGRFGRTSGRRR